MAAEGAHFLHWRRRVELPEGALDSGGFRRLVYELGLAYRVTI